jgi:hypothetical protein
MCLKQICQIILILVIAMNLAFGQSSLKAQMAAQTTSNAVTVVTPIQEPQPEKSRKSVLVAIAYSLVLPGLGEYYTDNLGTGRYFMGADAGLWLTYGGFRMYGKWLKDDAKTLAVEKASANFDGKDDKFEVNIGNFTDVLGYNEAKLRNREYDLLYDAKSTFAWQWSSDSDRLHFKDLRNRGESTLRSSQFVIGALVLNRVISAISAARSALAYNRALQGLTSWRVSVGVPGGMPAADGVELTFTREF